MARQEKDLFTQVREQTERALALLTAEIRKREAELQELLDQAREWRDGLTRSLAPALAGPAKKRPAKKTTTKKQTAKKSTAKRKSASRKAAKGSSRKKAATAKRKTASGGKRVDWDAILAALPATFTIDDVMKNPGAKAKGRNQVYPAINRWVKAKKARKVGTGRYKRVA